MSQGHDQGLLFKDQDKDKDLSSKDKDKDKDKDCIVKDKDQDKDCILVLESLRTRTKTRTNITDSNYIHLYSPERQQKQVKKAPLY